jgi:hypothetical protein
MQKTSVFSDFCCLPNKFALMALRPGFFGPCTLGRTWGTRPGKRASFFAQNITAPMNSTLRPQDQFI